MIVKVLFDIGDYRLCTFYVDLVLDRHSTWEAGNQLKAQMNVDNNTLDSRETTMKVEPLSIALERPEWSSLVESLLKEYKHLAYTNNANNKNQHDKELSRDISWKGNRLTEVNFINRSIYITFEDEAQPMDISVNEDQVISTSPKPEVFDNLTTGMETSGNSLEHPVLIDLGDATSVTATIDSVIDLMNKAQKRKREDEADKECNSENENDEEDEAEEKRLSLR